MFKYEYTGTNVLIRDSRKLKMYLGVKTWQPYNLFSQFQFQEGMKL